MFCRRVVVLLALFLATIPAAAQSRYDPVVMPFVFEPNRGQAGPAVRFLSHGNGYSFLLEEQGAVLAFANPALTVRMKLVGQNPGTRIEGVGRRSSVTNYFHGNDPSRWLKSVPNFEKIRYSGVYPGIDLIYYGRGRELEYDFEIQPLHDPSDIQIEFAGVDNLAVGPEGDLILSMSDAEIRHRRPVAFQRRGEVNVPVDASFVIRDDRVGFRIGEYDRSLPLTIDPTLVFSSFLGGTGNDTGNDVAVDAAGSVYVTGYTQSVVVETEPPVVTLRPPIEKSFEAFVTKLSSSGAVVYSSYFGGTPPAATAGSSIDDEAHSIALDGLGNMYVAGFTVNNDFPVVNAQTSRRGVQDAYIVKLDTDTGSIQFSTYLGGSGSDRAYNVAVDGLGNAYVAGTTTSRDYPVAGAFQHAFGDGLRDAFLTKFALDGSIAFSTYLGGRGDDVAFDVAVDSTGSAILTGFTSSINFPLSNALVGQYRGGRDDAFITKFTPQGNGLVFSTYWGGNDSDNGVRLAVDSSDTIYITGLTLSGDFPLKNPAVFFHAGVADSFLIKMHPDGLDVDFATFIGADDIEGGTAIAIGSDGYIYLGGFTTSLSFYAINAIGAFLRGPQDGFIMKIAPDAGAIAFSSFLGGFGAEGVLSLALDSANNAYVTGFTTSFDGFPFATNAFQGATAGGQDGFIAKINSDDVKTSVPYTFPANGGTQVSTAGQTAQTVFGYISVDVQSGLSPTGLAILDLRSAGVLLNEVSIPVPVPSLVGRLFVTSFTSNSTALTIVNPNDEEVTVDVYFTGNGTGTNVFRSFNLPAHSQVSGFVYAAPYSFPLDQIGTLTYTASLPVSAIGLRVAQAAGSLVNTYLPVIDPYTANMTPVTIPRFADGGGWSGVVHLVNPTEEVVTGEIRFFKEGPPGEPGLPFEIQTDKGVASVFSYSIQPRESYTLASQSAPVDIVAGHVDIVPDSGSFAPHAYAILNFAGNSLLTTTVEGIPAATEFEAYAEISGSYPAALGTTPALSLANSLDAPATVTLKLIGFDGTDSGLSAVVTLPPHGHLGRFLHEIPGFENLPSSFTGILRATTSQPGVTFVGFRARYNELQRFLITATGPLRDLGNTSPVVFPHIVDGGGYATQFILINGSSGAGATGNVRYLNPVGKPLNVGIVP